ncbi:dimethyl sulfoxide reductase anchor subunit [Bacillus sp. FJAT-29790]|uniref:dimethyl sulfoxide reductase anchor subunit family protein n=1 Tax=Bacillus sp. FJAT-29790 TaxID=1895002 RepID=UPI001C21A953|nr:DmsC/YnfH family molybdoenzyme membrane anchor subunit [Bacillus sp. FJAT-29790]MBU8879635.1 dimethyl sulfoxide reductase anchor subunit [Bacillus sp. FJAT-29790]
MHEWALLIFTLCVQTAIGGMFMLWLFHRTISKNGEEKAFVVLKTPLLIIAALSLIGLAASFSHLGTPSNAFNTIRNIGSSWMSREILVTGMFIGATCLTAGLAIVQKKLNPLLLLGTAIIGFVDIYCMAKIYANSLVSGWNSINTFTSFYGTAFLLGAVLVASITTPALRSNNMDDAAKNLIKLSFFTALFGIAIQLVGVALFPAAMTSIHIIATTAATSVLEGYEGTIALRWIIEIIGLMLLGYTALAPAKKIHVTVTFAALIAIGFAEGMSRYVFYVLGS